MKRTRIEDIAREAGVSKATVDRVIHNRGVVRKDTARKVAEAAHRVAYYASGLIDRQLAIQLPELKLGFLLIKEKQEFYQSLSRELHAAVAARKDFRGKVVIRYSPSQSPADFAVIMHELAMQSDVIACTAVNHSAVNEAALALRREGVPVFALLNDFARDAREAYIGLDNLKAGRLAAWMISTATRQRGKVAIFLGSNRWQGHELKETGFRSYLRQADVDLQLLEPIINLETRKLTHETSLALLERHPDLRGIYVAGGGMEGAIAALREARAPGEVKLVVNELTSVSRAALSDGYAMMVIGTPLAELCREAVDLMAGASIKDHSQTAGERFLEPQLFLPPSV
ncbi:LacI family DNA-binding transcriptional regulator [Rhizobium miluonense]|uniref:Transcriptional regulator, LacI family n=1 Tax=Rhizobium miluonense TaxID=411945 RepID=A0A1C3V5U7_9HYPH|nr:LacI family DNA-binding transcriptional regulator [Rhizobium miluonense]SCB22957.1 transcriptional regulator, LacI family [Rhizobium miluonense]